MGRSTETRFYHQPNYQILGQINLLLYTNPHQRQHYS